jgi:hypothetical protein
MRRRLLIGAAIVVAALLVVAWIAVGPLLSPHFRQNVLDVLGQHFGGNAELRELNVNFFPQPSVSGEGLVVRHRGRTDIPPLVAVERFSARATWIGLLNRPRRVANIELYGLKLTIPPRAKGESLIPDSLKSDAPKKDAPKSDAPTSGAATPATAPETRSSRSPVIVDRVHSSDALLSILPKDPKKDPRLFAISRLELINVDLDAPMKYSATLTNPKPPGAIETTGEFGPWAPTEPGDTPVRGAYTFSHADLGVFKGIDGDLSSKGTYSGVLERIGVRGTTTTPDFMVTLAGNPVALSTSFAAVVDGTNGNTWLDPVSASFLQSTIVAHGGVLKVEGVKGREVALEVTIDKARIEDLLKLAMKNDTPIMTGAARIRTKLRIPPGDVDVIEKLELDGEFHIAQARFTDFDVQKSITKLSRKGRGLPDAERGGSVVSDLKGRFVMRDGRITFSMLTFAVPGASVHLAGGYGLRSEALDFRGKVRLQATVSQLTTGVKRVLLKMFDPIFRKNGAGAEIPIKVEGSRDKPKFGFDAGAMLPGR